MSVHTISLILCSHPLLLLLPNNLLLQARTQRDYTSPAGCAQSEQAQSDAATKADRLTAQAQQCREAGRLKQACRLSYEAAKRYLLAGQGHAAGNMAAKAFVGGADDVCGPVVVFRNLPDLWTCQGSRRNKQLQSCCGIHWACWILLGRGLLRGSSSAGAGTDTQICFSKALGMIFPWQDVLDAAQALVHTRCPTVASFQKCERSCARLMRDLLKALLNAVPPVPFCDTDVRRLLFVVSYFFSWIM